MLLAALGFCTGYAAGTMVALSLDVLYTGALWRNPFLPTEWHGSDRSWLGELGYLVGRGKGTHGVPSRARFCYLSLLGGLSGVAIARRATDIRHAALLVIFSTLLLALTAADFERHLLPNRLMYPALVSAVLLGWAWPGRSWLNTLEGGAIAFIVMLFFFLVFPNLGFGDVKLSVLLGLVSGVSHALPALALGIVTAGISAGALLVAGRARRRSLIAYGPYLALGAFAGMLMR